MSPAVGSQGLAADARRLTALVRADAVSATSYRVRMILALVGLLLSFVPIFFVAEALQPVAAESIREEGGRYFGFLMVGLAVVAFVSFALRALPASVAARIDSGVLEALLATPTRLPVLIAGLVGYRFLRTTAQGVLFLGAIAVVGVPLAWSALPLAAGILVLTVVCHLGIGLVATALHLAYRTSGPLLTATLAASALLGGVYYSTTAIPDAIRPLAHAVPLTYGLRGIRQTLLQGDGFGAVASDVAILAGFTAVLLTIGVLSLRAGLDYARRSGTLGQY